MSIPLFDAHCDTIVLRKGFRRNHGQLDLERLSKYAPAAQVFAMYAPPPFDTPETFAKILKIALKKLGECSDLATLCTNARELRAAVDGGKIAAILSVEGSALLGCSIDGLENARSQGVSLVNITWNASNRLAGAAMDGDPHGLTAEGRAFVERAEELGMVIELSHCSDATFWDIAAISKKPLLVGHSDSRALCPHPRNISDEMFLAVRDSGGVVGLNLCRDFLGGDESMEAVALHAERFLSLGGEKAVCFGCDLDGIPKMPDGMEGVQDMDKLFELFSRRFGYKTAEDIFFNNLMSFMERAL